MYNIALADLQSMLNAHKTIRKNINLVIVYYVGLTLI